METKLFKRNAGQIYLTLVPVLTAVLGLGIGYVSYKIYLPIWLINVCLMGAAAWVLGAHVIRAHDIEKKHLVACALFLIVPWMLISVIAGLGAPPFHPERIRRSRARHVQAD